MVSSATRKIYNFFPVLLLLIFFFANYSGPPTEKTLTYARFPYDKHKKYQFSIYSANEVDRSEDSSHVFVPRFESKYRGFFRSSAVDDSFTYAFNFFCSRFPTRRIYQSSLQRRRQRIGDDSLRIVMETSERQIFKQLYLILVRGRQGSPCSLQGHYRLDSRRKGIHSKEHHYEGREKVLQIRDSRQFGKRSKQRNGLVFLRHFPR